MWRGVGSTVELGVPRHEKMKPLIFATHCRLEKMPSVFPFDLRIMRCPSGRVSQLLAWFRSMM